MAIAGGACSAYRCQIFDNQMVIRATTALRSECATPQQAIPLLASGEWVIVAGADLEPLRRLLTGNSEPHPQS